MKFFDEIFKGTKKELSVVDYFDYEKGYSGSEIYLSDIDGWLVCLKSLEKGAEQYCAPFSINIPDNWKRDDNIFSDEKLKDYIDATITKFIDKMSYMTNNSKDCDYDLVVVGFYTCFGIKMFKPINLGTITFKGKLKVEGGNKNEEKK